MSEKHMRDDSEDDQDGENATDDFNCNQLLPKNEMRPFEKNQSEICISNASDIPAATSEGLSLSSKGRNDEHFHDVVFDASPISLVSETVAYDDGKSVQNNNYLQNKEEKDIMEFRQDGDKLVEQESKDPFCNEEGKKREEFVRKSDTEDRKETVGGFLESIGTEFESMAVKSIEFREEGDRIDEISTDVAKGELSDAFVNGTQHRGFETVLHHDENKEPIFDNQRFDEIPVNRTVGHIDRGEFNEHSEEKADEVGHKEIAGGNAESDGRDETNFLDDSRPKIDVDSSLFIADEAKNLDSTQKDYFDEEESEYLSVTSNRYSSFESLDDARDKKKNTAGKGFILGNSVEMEAGTRPILGSETDRTEDDYVTCDEHSTVGADGHGDDDDNDDDSELQSFPNEHEIFVADSPMNESRGGNMPSSGYDDYDDYEGYETQDYLTADEQSEFDGTPENIRCIEGGGGENLITKKKQTDLVDVSTDDLVQLEEEGALDVMTEGEEYATADEMIKGDEDERSTIVGSDDDEEGDTVNVTSHENDVNAYYVNKPDEGDVLNQNEAGLSDLMEKVNNEEEVNLLKDDEVVEEVS